MPIFIYIDTAENEYSGSKTVLNSEIPVPPSPDKTVPENGDVGEGHELRESNGSSVMIPEIGEPLGTGNEVLVSTVLR